MADYSFAVPSQPTRLSTVTSNGVETKNFESHKKSRDSDKVRSIRLPRTTLLHIENAYSDVNSVFHHLAEPVLPVECARELWGVSFSEVPDKYYFALRQEHMVVEADATMQAIMEKLQVYRNRLTILFEGFQYELGDFHIKAGRAILAHTENLRGIILEVDYKPLSSVGQSRRVVQDFMESLHKGITTGQFVPLEPHFSEFSLPDLYSWQHTSLQYVTLMAFLLSQQRV